MDMGQTQAAHKTHAQANGSMPAGATHERRCYSHSNSQRVAVSGFDAYDWPMTI
jgi:hypothetical protein